MRLIQTERMALQYILSHAGCQRIDAVVPIARRHGLKYGYEVVGDLIRRGLVEETLGATAYELTVTDRGRRALGLEERS